MTYRDAIIVYSVKFGEGPPIFEMVEQAAIVAMTQAIERGVPMDSGIEDNLPESVLH